jgi:hypothetical protein
MPGLPPLAGVEAVVAADCCPAGTAGCSKIDLSRIRKPALALCNSKPLSVRLSSIPNNGLAENRSVNALSLSERSVNARRTSDCQSREWRLACVQAWNTSADGKPAGQQRLGTVEHLLSRVVQAWAHHVQVAHLIVECTHKPIWHAVRGAVLLDPELAAREILVVLEHDTGGVGNKIQTALQVVVVVIPELRRDPRCGVDLFRGLRD